MAADGDSHADDGDDECDQLNRTYDREPGDDMSNDNDDAYREFNDHNRTTGKSQNARYVMQINSRSNTLSAHTPIPTNRSKSTQWAMTASNAISL
jgi:hypothetical protein